MPFLLLLVVCFGRNDIFIIILDTLKSNIKNINFIILLQFKINIFYIL
jgi:hypothetical protein